MRISDWSSDVCSSDLFKLFVYLAALRYGMTPDTLVADEPITIADWSPKNDNGKYRGDIPLRTAFAISSNVAAARLTQEVGVRNVIRAARDPGRSEENTSELQARMRISYADLCWKKKTTKHK